MASRTTSRASCSRRAHERTPLETSPPLSPPPRSGWRAFTLVELLTVIAIIAMLAAIIFPTFNTARGKARQASCQSNLRQIGIGFQMYAQDYDGYLPYARDASDAFVPDIWTFAPQACQDRLKTMPMLHPVPDALAAAQATPWLYKYGVLDPYLKSKEIWRCAGDTGFDVLDNNDSCDGPCPMDAHPTMYEKYGASYLWRTAIPLAQKPIDALEARTFDGKLVGPAGINLLFDGNGSWHGTRLAWGKTGLRYVTLFVDGHAKLLTNAQYQEAWATLVTDPGANPCP
jgi:prepilin-type N-terminal cleavage/methylation domain-containing protein